MNIPIEPPQTEGYADVPTAPPGIYQMHLVRWKENVETRNGIRDVLNFVGEDSEGNDVGSSCWIKGPQQKPDGSMTKGNLWLYRKLADALGPEALEVYETKNENGFSTFRPSSYYGAVLTVTVNEYGVEGFAPKQETEPALPKKPDDDIPF